MITVINSKSATTEETLFFKQNASVFPKIMISETNKGWEVVHCVETSNTKNLIAKLCGVCDSKQSAYEFASIISEIQSN